MKNLIILLLSLIATTASYCQRDSVNIFYTPRTPSGAWGTFTNYHALDVTSDFGGRRKEPDNTYDWHGGIDFATTSQQLGDVIYAPFAATIADVSGVGLKSMAIRGANCTIGFRHLFTGTPNSPIPMISAGGRFVYIDGVGIYQRKAILDLWRQQQVVTYNPTTQRNDTTYIAAPIAYCQDANLTFTYLGRTYTTTNQVPYLAAICPLGNSSNSNTLYANHLHVQGIDDPSVTGAGLYSDANANNPLRCLAYPRPRHKISFIRNDVSLANTEDVSCFYFCKT
jgi:hypothetical protein